MYYIYMIRCKDNSIYTGITTDLQRRMEEHKSKSKKCAKYTLKHDFLKLEKYWETETRKQASKLEYHIKSLTKLKKEQIILDSKYFEKYLEEKIILSDYVSANY